MTAAQIFQAILDDYTINHDMRGAYDRVLGEGAYDSLVNSLYDAANAS